MTTRGADEEPAAAKHNQGWEWKQNQRPQQEQRQGQPAQPPPERNRAQNQERNPAQNREQRPWQRAEQDGNRDGDRDKDREQQLLRRGEEAEIAHHMAQNPDKQWEIRRAIRQEKREGPADFLAVFNRLIDSGVLERHDTGEPMYEVLQFLRESTDGVLGGVVDHVLPRSGAQRPALEERAMRPEPRRPSWDEEAAAGLGSGSGSRDGSGSGSPESYAAGPGDPHMYEPTRVESAAERDLGERRRSRRRPSRPSEAFDDWDEE